MMFQFTLAVSIGSVPPPLCGGVQVGPLLQQLSEVQPDVNNQLVLLHGNAWDIDHLTVGVCMHHWRIARRLDLFAGGPVFLGRSRRRCSAMLSSLDTCQP